MTTYQEVPQDLKHLPSLPPSLQPYQQWPRAAMQCKQGALLRSLPTEMCNPSKLWQKHIHWWAQHRDAHTDSHAYSMCTPFPHLISGTLINSHVHKNSSHVCFLLHVPTGCIDTVACTLSDIHFLSCLSCLTHTQTQWKQWAAIKQFSPSQLPHQANKGSHSLPQMVDHVPCC